MDSRNLELWGYFLLQAAKNQQLLELFWPEAASTKDQNWDFSSWVQYCYTHSPYFQDLFHKSLEKKQNSERGRQASQGWQEGMDAFYEQYRQFAGFLGLVPQREYDKLLQENEHLKERLQGIEQTMQQLHNLMEQKGIFDSTQISEEMGKLFQEQNEQFKKLLHAWEQTWHSASNSADQDPTEP